MRAVPPRKTSAMLLLVSGGALLVLACSSFALSFVPLGVWALPLALCIAAVKAAVVVSVFMELRHESASIQLASLAAAFMLLLLVALTAGDVVTRSVPVISVKAANSSKS